MSPVGAALAVTTWFPEIDSLPTDSGPILYRHPSQEPRRFAPDPRLCTGAEVVAPTAASMVKSETDAPRGLPATLHTCLALRPRRVPTRAEMRWTDFGSILLRRPVVGDCLWVVVISFLLPAQQRGGRGTPFSANDSRPGFLDEPTRPRRRKPKPRMAQRPRRPCTSGGRVQNGAVPVKGWRYRIGPRICR